MEFDAPVTVVVGLGNSVRGDDRVGLAVAEALRKLLENEPIAGVEVRLSERGGFEILDLLAGASRAIIVDCLEVAEPQPGRVRRLTVERTAGSARLTGAHDVSLESALELGRLLGTPIPSDIEVYGIEAKETGELSERLTPEVEAAVQPFAAWLHGRLDRKA